MSASGAREVLIGIIALLGFVMIATTVAGESEKAADIILALFLSFVALQLMTHGSLFQKFLSAHPVITGQVTPNK